jgi:hypothetical protein
VSRRLAATPGAVGARMPRLPDEEGLGRGQRKLLKWLINHPNDVEAAAAAAAVHLTPERVEAWLEGLALRLPCRVRITRRGQATYDFEPADLSAELRRDVLRGLGRPFAWVGLALINLGASWPLLFSIGLVAGGLASITSWEDEFIYFGVGILVGVAVLAAGVLAISALLGWIMGPPTGTEVAPEGGGALSPRQQARALERDQRVRERARRSQKPVLEEPPKKKSRSWDIGNIDDPRGLLVIVVAILLLVVVGSALVGLYAWGVGLWRSLSGHRLHAEWMGPAAWARQQPKADSWMRLVPTNDMVGRAVRSLRAALRRPRPADGHLADRVAALVRRGRGRLSSLELALHEGLDPDDAIEVLTRICVRHEGRIVVSRSGDLVVFIPVFARASDTEGVPPFEALVGQGGGQVVSLPGLEAADRDAAARLAGGTWLLALGTAWLVAEAPGAWGVLGWVAAGVSLAVTCLAAAVRHAIRAHAASPACETHAAMRVGCWCPRSAWRVKASRLRRQRPRRPGPSPSKPWSTRWHGRWARPVPRSGPPSVRSCRPGSRPWACPMAGWSIAACWPRGWRRQRRCPPPGPVRRTMMWSSSTRRGPRRGSRAARRLPSSFLGLPAWRLLATTRCLACVVKHLEPDGRAGRATAARSP